MARANFNRLMLRGGLTLAAALMLTTAGFGLAQAGGFDEPVTEPVVVVVDDAAGDDGSDVNTGEDTIAVGEPDTSGDGSEGVPDVPVDDGSGSGTDVVIDDPVDDGSGGGTGDWVDGGSGDGTGDGTGDWVDDGSGGGTGDGTGDWVDDGSGGGTDDRADAGTGGDGAINEGEVVIYYMNGGPVPCAECEVAIADMSVEAYQMSADSPLVAANDAPAAKPRRSASRSVAASSMADCLALHPQLPWICEWQNGAGH